MEQSRVLCEYYISSWITLYTIGGIPNLEIMFCRFINGHGLVEDLGKLFHKIVVLALSVFKLHMLLIWPINATLSDNDYTHMVKGRICNKIEFPWEEENFI